MAVSLLSLWLPILVASVLVFVAGFILNTLLPHHRTDFAALPDEDRLMEAARAQQLKQTQYLFPFAATRAEVQDPAFVEKANAGPVGILVVWPNGVGPMTKQLITHFVYVLVLSLLAGYVAGASLPAGTAYLKVFQVVGIAAWLGYAGAVPLFSIWYRFSWSFTGKQLLDGLVYALLTAGTFGWLWP